MDAILKLHRRPNIMLVIGCDFSFQIVGADQTKQNKFAPKFILLNKTN